MEVSVEAEMKVSESSSRDIGRSVCGRKNRNEIALGQPPNASRYFFKATDECK